MSTSSTKSVREHPTTRAHPHRPVQPIPVLTSGRDDEEEELLGSALEHVSV